MTQPAISSKPRPNPFRIVLTGGPGAGKTTVAAHLLRRFAQLHLVEEAATQVYASRKTRWDRLDADGRRDIQRRIYRLQLEQEARIAQTHPDRTLLLDRGTVDGAAYWPDGPDHYWRDLGTTLEQELARYDAVLWLQTGAILGDQCRAYDGDTSNPCRFENPEAAIATGERLAHVWSTHLRLIRIDAFPRLEDKIARVVAEVEGLLVNL